jgi:hypothetical protein
MHRPPTGVLPKVVAQLTLEQKQMLSTALVDALQWSLTLASSRGPEVLIQVLGAAGDQPAKALTAALDAAVVAKRHDLTLAHLQAHVLAIPDTERSTLSAGLVRLVRLCKHVLRKVSSTAQQQWHGQKVVVQLVQKVVAGNTYSLTTPPLGMTLHTWGTTQHKQVGTAPVGIGRQKYACRCN